MLALVSTGAWATDEKACNPYERLFKIETKHHPEERAVLQEEIDHGIHDAQGWHEILSTDAKRMLGWGDDSLEKGCFEVADKFYRYVLATFTEPSLAAYRQRAIVGIEDVTRMRATRTR